MRGAADAAVTTEPKAFPRARGVRVRCIKCAETLFGCCVPQNDLTPNPEAGMAYEKHPDDTTPAPGGMSVEAAKRLARRPEQRELLHQFVDMWGIDGYDPFGVGGCSGTVRQIVTSLLIDADHFAQST